jgi:hypothetical protein
MSRRICILTLGQATQLERQGIVPRCSWHQHCSESKALDLYRMGEARIVDPAKGCKHPKPAIQPIARKDFRPAATDIGASRHGAPQLRIWQLVR